jgi:2-polyprenyl-6-methoxyphenol hydroxylase-like FAD-dependent oxidoreductase
MQAVIRGAGADALVLAHRLSLGGWHVVLLQDDTHSTPKSCLIELASDALAALKDLDLFNRVLECAEPIARVRWIDERGRSIAGVQMGSLRHPSSDSVYITRENLERLLLETLPPSVIRCDGISVQEVVEHGDRVELKLSSGASLSSDLLVAADGGRSRIRELVFGSDGVWRRPLGFHVASFVFRDANVRREVGSDLSILSTPGRLLALCPLRDGEIVATFAFRMFSLQRPRSPASTLAAEFADLQWCVPAVLEHAQATNKLHYDRATQIKAATWHRERVGLLGDACYAYSLLPGQGCNSAIVAAHVLGEGLARGMPFDAAFDGYESQLAHQIAARRQAARRIAGWLIPRSKTDLAIRNGLLRIARVPGLGRLVKPAVSLAL